VAGERTTDDPPLRDEWHVDANPLWLTHHWPDEYDRCATVRGRLVCRRCLVLYPLALVAALVLAHVASWPERLDPWFLWLLPLPAVVEFVAEQLRLVRHSPRRLVVLTTLLAVACGRLYVRYLDDHTDGLVWTVVTAYAGACLAAWFVRAFRPRSV
jgi:uncharacterized membrane protein